jgi:hypothetical protein
MGTCVVRLYFSKFFQLKTLPGRLATLTDGKPMKSNRMRRNTALLHRPLQPSLPWVF